jgi:CRISPR-associated endonuclease/helicase Cas3
LGVAKRAVEALEGLGLNDKKREELSRQAYLAGLFHDLGKLDPGFQGYINKKIKKKSQLDDQGSTDAEEGRKGKGWHGVFHQEISWAMLESGLRATAYPIDTLKYAVYWHHPAALGDEGRMLARPRGNEIISDLADHGLDFTEFMAEAAPLIQKLIELADASYAQGIAFGEQRDIQNTSVPDYYILKSSKGGRIEKNADQTLVAAALIEADRAVSGLSPRDLSDYLLGSYTFSAEPLVREFPPEPPDDSARTTEQKALAQAAADCGISVCGVDTGAGKTRIALYWKKRLAGRRPLIFALPKRRLVDAMYGSVTADYAAIFGCEPPSLQSAHTGKVQASTDGQETILASDVNIIVFDRLLSSFYRRGQFSEFARMLKSDLVFDEFHEFTTVERMLPALRVILKIRSWMSGGARTLLLSGTPDKALLRVILGDAGSGKYSYFPRSSMSPVNANTRRYKYVDAAPLGVEHAIYSFNRVGDAQDFARPRLASVFLIHSKFRDSDLAQKIKELLGRFGKSAPESESSVASASMLQSSFDISRRNGVLTIANPNTVAQYLGRIDRHGKHGGGTVYLLKEANESVFKKNLAGYKDTYDRYRGYLEESLGREGKVLSHREATELVWDEFWKDEAAHAGYLKELEERALEAEKKVSSNFPIKRQAVGGKGGPGKSLFRDESFIAIAKIVNDDGSDSGKMTSVDDPISLSQKWLITKFKDAMRGLKTPVMSRLNEDGFKFNKHVLGTWAIGKSPLTPIVMSHFDPEVDKGIRRGVDRDAVYSLSLGLIVSESDDSGDD